MYLLSKEGRGAFLTFVRNLTPQALLLSVSALLLFQWMKNPESWLYLILSILIFSLAFLAGYASFSEFADNAISQAKVIAARSDQIRAETNHPGTRLRRIVTYVLKEQPQTLIELLIAVSISYLGLLAIVWTAISSAYRVLR